MLLFKADRSWNLYTIDKRISSETRQQPRRQYTNTASIEAAKTDEMSMAIQYKDKRTGRGAYAKSPEPDRYGRSFQSSGHVPVSAIFRTAVGTQQSTQFYRESVCR